MEAECAVDFAGEELLKSGQAIFGAFAALAFVGEAVGFFAQALAEDVPVVAVAGPVGGGVAERDVVDVGVGQGEFTASAEGDDGAAVGSPGGELSSVHGGMIDGGQVSVEWFGVWEVLAGLRSSLPRRRESRSERRVVQFLDSRFRGNDDGLAFRHWLSIPLRSDC